MSKHWPINFLVDTRTAPGWISLATHSVSVSAEGPLLDPLMESSCAWPSPGFFFTWPSPGVCSARPSTGVLFLLTLAWSFFYLTLSGVFFIWPSPGVFFTWPSTGFFFARPSTGVFFCLTLTWSLLYLTLSGVFFTWPSPGVFFTWPSPGVVFTWPSLRSSSRCCYLPVGCRILSGSPTIPPPISLLCSWSLSAVRRLFLLQLVSQTWRLLCRTLHPKSKQKYSNFWHQCFIPISLARKYNRTKRQNYWRSIFLLLSTWQKQLQQKNIDIFPGTPFVEFAPSEDCASYSLN